MQNALLATTTKVGDREKDGGASSFEKEKRSAEKVESVEEWRVPETFRLEEEAEDGEIRRRSISSSRAGAGATSVAESASPPLPSPTALLLLGVREAMRNEESRRSSRRRYVRGARGSSSLTRGGGSFFQFSD